LKNQGVCTWSNMPYNVTDCSLLPNANQQSNAGQNKIRGFNKLTVTDFATIKRNVASDNPVMAVITVYANFFAAAPGYIYNNTSGGYAGMHAVAICGYDDARNAFKIENSWGTAWGEGGYSWIDYNFFGQISTEAYVFK
ncbi:MAG: C1 family peptidase, partial [Flavobacterium sp.]